MVAVPCGPPGPRHGRDRSQPGRRRPARGQGARLRPDLRAPARGPARRLRVAWEQDFDARQMIGFRDSVIASDADGGDLVAFSVDDGDERWRVDARQDGRTVTWLSSPGRRRHPRRLRIGGLARGRAAGRFRRRADGSHQLALRPGRSGVRLAPRTTTSSPSTGTSHRAIATSCPSSLPPTGRSAGRSGEIPGPSATRPCTSVVTAGSSRTTSSPGPSAGAGA